MLNESKDLIKTSLNCDKICLHHDTQEEAFRKRMDMAMPGQPSTLVVIE